MPSFPTGGSPENQGTSGMTYSDHSREPPSYHCGNGCSFDVFETGEQIERWSYFFIVS